MRLDELKNDWEQHKKAAALLDISEADILSVIREEDNFHLCSRRLLQNAMSFSFLLIFCQTC